MPDRRHRVAWGPLCLLILVACLPVAVQSRYHQSIAVIIGLHTIAAVGLSLLMGYAGQVSLGHAAFYGLGAYVSAIASTGLGLNPWVAMPLAALVTGVLAASIGTPIFRLRGHFLAMATLGCGIIVYIVFNELRDVTGGPSGLTGIPNLRLFGMPLNTDLRYYYLVWAVALGVIFLSRNIVDSRVGRALRAIRGSESAAAALGVNTPRYKLAVFTLSAVYASLAGSLYAHYLLFVNPPPFSFKFSIELLVMVMIGGLAHIWGALFGAALITILGEGLRATIPLLMGHASGEYEIIAFGLILMATMIALPGGLWPWLTATVDRFLGGLGAARPPSASSALWNREALTSAPLQASPPRPEVAPATRRGKEPSRGAVTFGPILEVRELSKAFAGLQALSRVSFTVQPQEILAIIGPNGAGKTTLFSVIAGALPPTGGTVRFAGQAVQNLTAHRVATAGLIRTFQNVRLFGAMTVLENVMVGLHQRTRAGMLAAALRLPRVHGEERDSRDEAGRLLALVGLEEQADVPASNLPFGQQRLVEVTRALAANPAILLLDEPGAGLSAGEREWLRGLVRRIRAAGVSVILVDHDMDLIMDLADRIVVLNYGEKIAEGTPAEIQHDPQVIAAYLGGEVVRAPARGAAAQGGDEGRLLTLDGVVAGYGRAEALHGVSLQVRPGEIVTLNGPNGAGKTTLLNAVMGVTPPREGRIRLRDRDIAGLAPERMAPLGVGYVPERRQIFSAMTVLDNLWLGAYHRYARGKKGTILRDLERVFTIFPVLREREQQVAGTLSGGEQQMLALGRALMARPDLLLLDEPSLGLAPLVVAEIMRVIADLRRDGMTVLLVEQNVRAALAIADRGYVMEGGRIVLQGSAPDLLEDERVRRAYLGRRGDADGAGGSLVRGGI